MPPRGMGEWNWKMKQSNPVTADVISLTDHKVSLYRVPFLASPGHEMSVEFVEWIIPL